MKETKQTCLRKALAALCLTVCCGGTAMARGAPDQPMGGALGSIAAAGSRQALRSSTAAISPPERAYTDPARTRAFYDALLERTAAAGYRFLSVGGKPIDRPFGRFVFAKDPDGVLVEYVEPAVFQ